MNIKTIFMGTPDFAVPILEALMQKTDVILVVTQPDKEVGRKKVLTPSPIKELAIKNNIPVFQPTKIRIDYEPIKNLKPDLIVTCAYGQIIPKEVLDIPRLGCINVHASLLPKYRGGAPIHHAIINGEEETGITIMYMDEGMDTGDIITMAKIPITPIDNTATMHDKLSHLGSELLLKTLPDIINGTNTHYKQDNDAATYAKIIKRDDEHLNFNDLAKNVHNRVRGLNSWPLAYALMNNQDCKIIEGYIGEETTKEPGTIVKVLKDAIGVACQDNIYYITKLKPFGKKAMSAKDYLNGLNGSSLLNKKFD